MKRTLEYLRDAREHKDLYYVALKLKWYRELLQHADGNKEIEFLKECEGILINYLEQSPYKQLYYGMIGEKP